MVKIVHGGPGKVSIEGKAERGLLMGMNNLTTKKNNLAG
jgi:hypothetical protein